MATARPGADRTLNRRALMIVASGRATAPHAALRPEGPITTGPGPRPGPRCGSGGPGVAASGPAAGTTAVATTPGRQQWSTRSGTDNGVRHDLVHVASRHPAHPDPPIEDKDYLAVNTRPRADGPVRHPLLELTFAQLIARQAAAFRERELLADRAKRLTYAQFAARMTDVARALMASGVGPGDRVGAAELVLVRLRHREPRGSPLEDEGADALVVELPVDRGERDHEVGDRPAGAEHLGAVQHPAVAVQPGRRAQ